MSASMRAVVLHLCVATSLVGLADANFLLQSSREQVHLVDVEALPSVDDAEVKLSGVEAGLRPMFATLPKNEHGNLAPAAVRYALHRYFAKKHGWSVKGLEAGGSSQNTSSPTNILQDRVPAYIEEKFEQHLGGRGLDLRHLSALAFTIEHLVHGEEMGRLHASYWAHQLPPTELVTLAEAGEIIDAYMRSHILGVDLSNLTTLELDDLKGDIAMSTYPGWREAQEWTWDLQLGILYADRGFRNPFVGFNVSFAHVAHVVEEIGDRYATFLDIECKDVKNALLERESAVPGRVQISEFYRSDTNGGSFHFGESSAYLRQIGALDESDPEMPSVVVPNYISGPSNCVGRQAGFYSLCCISQCEGLMGHLENSIAMPTAEPQRIAAIVASMPSDTMDAPRNLSSALLARLDSIAQRHGGRIPLHGRLFAQWMHHAYPNECPYPPLIVETVTQTASAEKPWIRATHLERSRWRSNATSDEEADPVAEKQMPWVDFEDPHIELEALPVESAQCGLLWTALRSIVLVGALFCTAVSIANTYQSALPSRDVEKYSV